MTNRNNIITAVLCAVIIFGLGFGCGYKVNTCEKSHCGPVSPRNLPAVTSDTNTVVTKRQEKSDFTVRGKKTYYPPSVIPAPQPEPSDSMLAVMELLQGQTGTIGRADNCPEFVAEADTTIGNAIYNLRFDSRTSLFSVMRQIMYEDTTKYITRTVPLPVEVVREPNVVQDILTGVAFFGAGYAAKLVVDELRD